MDTGCKTSKLTRMAVITVGALCCFCVLMSCGRTKIHRTSFASWKTMEVPELGIRLEVPRKRYRPSLIGIMESYTTQIAPMYKKADSEVIRSGMMIINCHPNMPAIPLVDVDYVFSVTIERVTPEMFRKSNEQWKRLKEDPRNAISIDYYDELLFRDDALYINSKEDSKGNVRAVNYTMLRYYRAPNGDIIIAGGGFQAYESNPRGKDEDLAALKRIIHSVKIDEKPPEIDIIYD